MGKTPRMSPTLNPWRHDIREKQIDKGITKAENNVAKKGAVFKSVRGGLDTIAETLDKQIQNKKAASSTDCNVVKEI